MLARAIRTAHSALQNAASIAGLNLSTSTVITEVKDKSEPVSGAVT